MLNEVNEVITAFTITSKRNLRHFNYLILLYEELFQQMPKIA